MIIYVDAGCSGNPGKTYYRGVDEYGEILFERLFSYGTNNIGEWLAIATAWAYLIEKKGGKGTIYSDSKTALAWWEKRRVSSTLPRNSRSNLIFACVGVAVKYIESHEADFEGDDIKIEWWCTKEKGEIPADYGLKSNSKYQR